jgi:hypothetical protein
MLRQSLACLLFVLPFIAYSQEDSVSQKRLAWVLGAGGTAYGIGMYGLSEAWYKDQQSASFHFFDDGPQWKQMDKLGHSFSAYHISFAAHGTYRWAGLSERKAVLWGAATSAIMMTPVELLDGFSQDFGFSWWDIVANTGGAGLFAFQKLQWKEIRIQPKISFRRTSFASYRPEVLGSGWQEEWLKDYNGQNYWFTFNPYLLSKGNSGLPKWLGISLGYGASEMVYGRNQENLEMGWDPYRQYYLSVDIDFKALKGHNHFVNTLLDALNLIKVPAPTLSLDRKNGMKAYWLYF